MRKETAATAALAIVFLFLFGCALFPAGLPEPGQYKGGQITNPAPDQPPLVTPTPTPAPRIPPELLKNLTNQSLNGTINGTLNQTNKTEDNLTLPNITIENKPEPPLKVLFLNAGFADATLIKAGEFTILVDAGSAASEPSLERALNAANVTNIDMLILSNWDDGKIGGVPGLTSAFTVHSVWHNGELPAGPLQRQMLRPLDSLDLPQQVVQAGERFDYGNLSLQAYNPQKARYENNMNADAIAMKVSFGKFCLFLPSDMEDSIDAQVVNQEGIGPCALYKWKNHGAGMPAPPQLYNRLEPKAVIISTGPNGKDLPSPTTLERINISRAKLYRTDKDGTVLVSAYANGSYFIYPKMNESGIYQRMVANLSD